MLKLMRHYFYAAVCFSLGSMCVWFYATAKIVRYLAEPFRVPCLIGGLCMCVVGVFLMVKHRGDCCGGHDHDEEEEHVHEEVNPIMLMILMALPLLGSLAATKGELSDLSKEKLSNETPSPDKFAYLGDKLPPFTKETLDEIKVKSVDGAYKLSLIEIFYSSNDPEMQGVLTEIRVETEGKIRIKPGGEASDGERRLYRLFMTCCATDMQAIPISLKISPELSDPFAEHSWVRLAGKLSYRIEGGVRIAEVIVDRIDAAIAPEEEFDLNY